MSSVLILNKHYTPIGTTTPKNAVSLMLRERAEKAWGAGVARKFRTPSGHFEVPNVLRLRYYDKVPKLDAIWTRYNVLKRDDYTCVYCGRRPGGIIIVDHERITLNKSDFTVDHLIPQSRGGKDTWGNTAASCYWCNHRKADRTPNEAGMPLRFEPKIPRTKYLIASGSMPSEWKLYIKL
jgi:5-methylcytosine-specific restriction endonuclease McrA